MQCRTTVTCCECLDSMKAYNDKRKEVSFNDKRKREVKA